MSSCHDTPEPTPVRGRSAAAVETVDQAHVVLVGNPNVGKSTLFNVLTGGRQRVMNAPGTTVELHSGTWRGRPVRLTDLPGTYSLLARSPDEQVTADAVAGTSALGVPDLAVVLVEAAALSRSLYLLAQVAERGLGVVVALTMTDVAATRGIHVDPDRCAAVLGVPVVELDPRTGRGATLLAEVVETALVGPVPRLAPAAGTVGSLSAHSGLDSLRGSDDLDDLDDRDDRGDLDDPADAGRCDGPSVDDALASAERHFAWVEQVLSELTTSSSGPSAPSSETTSSGTPSTEPTSPRPSDSRATRSDRVDRVLLDPWFGIPVFLAVMWGLFQLATAVAAPLMDAVDRLVNGTLAGALRAVVGGPAWVEGFLVDGLLAGVGTVLSFAPLMALMFLAIAVLEDSGYLARAAFVADRAMRTIGLDGRAMLPLVVGFGCNLPALAATRTLPNARQRLLTGLLVPYTSCAARLTVYILLASVFFPGDAGTAIFLMYVASIALVVVGGLVLRATAFRDLRREPLVLALPAYQRPRLRALGVSAWVRVRAFLTKAGRIIVATLVVVWVLQAVPVTGGHPIGDVTVEDSAYGWTAEAVSPVFAPAGFDDWHASAALVTGFVAKEVVVGSFAQSYAVDEPDDPAVAGDLGSRLRATFEATSGGHAGAAAAAFMVFVLAYTPCLATVAEQKRLFGTRWTLGAVGVQLAVAWMAAVLVFQVGRLL